MWAASRERLRAQPRVVSLTGVKFEEGEFILLTDF
jgi:hypothetical protein